MINKYDSLPLYVQLQRLLKEDIVSGKYQEGDLIPSETQLAKMYNITRTTVRKAIATLVNEGLLHQVHGKGTYVCMKQVKYNIWNFGGFTDYLKSRHEIPYSKILDSRITKIEGQPYFLLKRARGVRKADGSILYLTVDTSLLPMALFPGIDQIDFTVASIYHTMRSQYGIFPKRAELSLGTVNCDASLDEIFRSHAKTSLLMAEGHVFDTNNVEIEKVQVVYGPLMEFKIVANMDSYFPL